jgi:Chaperone of endosialidase
MAANVCLCAGNVQYVAAQALGPSLTVLNAVSVLTNTVNSYTNTVNALSNTVATSTNTLNLVYSTANSALALGNVALEVAEAAYAVANVANTINVTPAFDQANTALAVGEEAYTAANGALNVAIQSFAQANTGYAAANAAQAAAVAANVTAQSAITLADAGNVFAQTVQTLAETGINNANLAFAQANAAVIAANAANTLAQSAVVLAVGGNVWAQSAITAVATLANDAQDTADAAWGTANAAGSLASGANLLATYANTTANLGYNQANTANALAESAAVLAVAANVFAQTVATIATQADNTANGAFEQANNAYAQANLSYSTGNSALSLATTANNTAAGAFAEANIANGIATTANSTAIAANAFAQTVLTIATTAAAAAAAANANALLAYAQANAAYAAANIANTNAVGAGFDAANANSYTATVLSYAQTVNVLATVANTTANLGYMQANAAIAVANLAYAEANTANSTASLSFAQANNAFGQANDALEVAIEANSYAQSVFVQLNTFATIANTTANLAYGAANLAISIANLAYTQANTANGTAGLSYAQANLAYGQANDALEVAIAGNTYAQSVYVLANTANIFLTFAYEQANAALIQANAAFEVAAEADENSGVANSIAQLANNTAFAANVVSAEAFALSANVAGVANTANAVAQEALIISSAAANTVATYLNGTLVIPSANVNFNNAGDIGFVITADGTSIANISPYLVGRGVSALNFGADPTGTLDSTTALQNAANAASSNHTFVYLPGGTYHISNTITNQSAPSWMGFQTEAFANVTINCSALPPNVNAFNIVNASVGFAVAGGLQISGPGTSGNLCSGLAFLSPGLGIADQVHLADVEIKNFAANSLFLNNPITSTFERVRVQGFGQNGFVIEPHPGNLFDGGTSTTWINCYANGGLCANGGAGYNFNGHQYFTMEACAADGCANSYYFNQCTGFTLNSPGNEANIQTPYSNGVSFTLNNCVGFVISAPRTYNLPAANSTMFNVFYGGSGTIINPVYTADGFTPTTEIYLDPNTKNISVLAPYSSGKPGNAANVSDNGTNNFVQFGNQILSQLNLNTTANGQQEPAIAFANTVAAGQMGYTIKRLSTVGANGSLAVLNQNNQEIFVIRDQSMANGLTFIQVIDSANANSGRISFGDIGAHVDFNNLNPLAFTIDQPIFFTQNVNAQSGLSVAGLASLPNANIGTIYPLSGGLLDIVANGINAGLSLNNQNSAQTWYVTVNGNTGDLVFYNPATAQSVLTLSNTNQLAQFGGTIDAPQLVISQNTTTGNLAVTQNTTSGNLSVSGNAGFGTSSLDSTLRVAGANGTGARIGYQGTTNFFDANTQTFRNTNGGTTILNLDAVNANVSITANVLVGSGLIQTTGNISAGNVSTSNLKVSGIANIGTANITTLAPTTIQNASGADTILNLTPITGSNSNSVIQLGMNGSAQTWGFKANYVDQALHILYDGTTVATLGSTGQLALQANATIIQPTANADANVLITAGGTTGGGNSNAIIRMVNSSNGVGNAWQIVSRSTTQNLHFMQDGTDRLYFGWNGDINTTGNVVTTHSVSTGNLTVTSSSNLASDGVYNGGTLVVAGVANLNFNGTSSLNVAVTANGTQSNVAWSANGTAIVGPTATIANTALTNAGAAYGQANSAYAQANLAYAAANAASPQATAAAANTVATYANGTLILASANINFNNTATVNVSVIANGTSQANIAFSANSSALGAGGSSGQIQYNAAGAFGGSSNLTFIDGNSMNVGVTLNGVVINATQNVSAANVVATSALVGASVNVTAINLSAGDVVINSSPPSYGSITMSGSTGSYAGIEFTGTTGDATLMLATSGTLSGIYNQGTSTWQWYVSAGELFGVTSCNGAWTVGGTCTATTFDATSDRNKKTNIRKINDAQHIVASLNGVRFDWKNNGKASAGLIAQDVEAVMPELVSTDQDGAKSLNYNGIIGAMIEEMKALRAEIEALKAR